MSIKYRCVAASHLVLDLYATDTEAFTPCVPATGLEVSIAAAFIFSLLPDEQSLCYRKLDHLSQMSLPPPLFSCGLAEVLREASALLAVLSSPDLGALSGCNKQLRRFIHSSVKAVTVKNETDLAALLSGTWPQLALIQVTSMSPDRVSAVSKMIGTPKLSNLRLMASVVSAQAQHHAIAFIVRATKQSHQIYQHIAAAFSYLRSPHWQLSTSLDVTISTKHSAAVVQHMVQLDWPHVDTLVLTDNSSDYTAMECLAQGSWPKLVTLDLSKDELGEAAMGALVQGRWSSLKELKLDTSPNLIAAAIAQIPKAAHWTSLSELNLPHVRLDSTCMKEINLMHQYLRSLDLSSCSIGTAAMSQLCSVSWPRLQCLTLSDNGLTADAMSSLAAIDLPDLTKLSLRHNQLDTAAAACLASGAWPKLEYLNLNENDLEDTAMAMLAKGEWPTLRCLMLCRNGVSALGVRRLMASQWPQLSRLFLDNTAVCASTWELLDLAPSKLPVNGWMVRPIIASRNFRSDVDIVWPNLMSVNFIRGY